MPGPSLTQTLPDLLHRVFGHREFRAHQQVVCEAAAAGRDVLLVMPTGAGKSLCYQLPALARGGTGLVISPLIALMDDQAAKLSALGLRVARVHSGLSREDARQACRDYLAGALDFLFIAPERMRVPGFPEMLAKRKPALIAIDEAHCISQWGHDFRPDYRTVGQHLPPLRPAPIVALTATATPAVQRDIARQLELRDPAIFITGFRRDNLAVEVIELSKPQRPEFTEELLAEKSARPAIVYAPSRKAAEELATRLNKRFRAAAYHAGLETATRERVQREFLGGKLEVVVATVAFGMGVDKADVRTVVHVALPGSVEAYYQEIGRAGRDGQPSRTVLLYSFADRKMLEFLLERNYPERSDLERVARALGEEFIEPETLQRKLKLDRETLDRAIEKLVVQGVALADWNGNVRATGESGWQDGYDAQVAARRNQIDRMMAFAEGTGCRMTALVQHFGDMSDRLRACERCDMCKPYGANGSAMRQPDAGEREKMRAILAAVASRGTSTGKLFSELALTRERKEFDAWLDALARAGLLTIANDSFRATDGRDVTYRKVAITHEGRTPDDETLDTVWIRSVGGRSEKKASRRSPRERDSEGAEVALTPSAAALAERLREWRAEEAREGGKPAFTILHDSTLRAIAAAGPKTLAELGRVKGMGAQKVEQLGASILALCRGERGRASEPAAKERKQGEPKPDRSRIEAIRPTPTGSHGEGVSSTSRLSSLAARFPAKPEAKAAREPTALDEKQKQIHERLRAWRKDQAHAAGLPSFFIFSDTVLREIALASPATLDQLRGVPGVAPEKLDRFGPALLELCRV